MVAGSPLKTESPGGATVTSAPPGAAALTVSGLTKVYGATNALAGVELEVQSGEIHALVGQNGAGKSTLVRIVAGLEPPDWGSVTVFDETVHFPTTASEMQSRGLAFIHQQLGLIEDMSVTDNMMLYSGYPRAAFGRIDWPEAHRQAREALAAVQLDIDPENSIASLPPGYRTLATVARALAVDARILILDEPTASLSGIESDLLFERLHQIRHDGVTVVVITHRIDEVIRHCDSVTVIRDGQTAARLDVANTTQDQLQSLISDGPLVAAQRRSAANSAALLELDGVVAGQVGPVSFSMAAGDIIGLAGRTGAGHETIGRVLFGLVPIDAGEIRFDDEVFEPASVRQAMRTGVGYLPADRRADAAVDTMNLRENLNLNPRQPSASRIVRRSERADSAARLRRFGVRPADPEAEFTALSGGNAQKVILARWLAHDLRLLVLNDPTMAIDVGARREIHHRLAALADEGLAVILISSDFAELSELCRKVIIFSGGDVAGSLEGDDLTVDRIAEAIDDAA